MQGRMMGGSWEIGELVHEAQTQRFYGMCQYRKCPFDIVSDPSGL